jgi:hypothetical protein
MVKLSLDIEGKLFEDLKRQSLINKSNYSDLIFKYIKQGLDKEKVDTMENINIADEIRNGIFERSREINCSPEKLVNSILYDYLRKVKELPPTIDAEKIKSMLDHDNPEGDDVLEKLFYLGEIGWD